MALLLRYIIGSAIHLNHTYGGKPPRSLSVFLLFKDLMFLVLFGMLALYIMEAVTLEDFIRRVMLFVGAGFAWSIIDYFFRRFWSFDKRLAQGDTRMSQIIDLVVVSFLLGSAAGYSIGVGAKILIFFWRAALVVIVGIVFAIINHLYTPKDIRDTNGRARFGAYGHGSTVSNFC